MALESIYYISQTIAVVVILCSLIFVGLQLRESAKQRKQSNALARADMSERTMRSFGELMNEIARHSDLAGAFRKVMFEPAELTTVETTQVLAYLNATLHVHRTAYLSESDGLIDARALTDFDNNTAWLLTSPVFAREWRRIQRIVLFSGDFVDHVNLHFAKLYPNHDAVGPVYSSEADK